MGRPPKAQPAVEVLGDPVDDVDLDLGKNEPTEEDPHTDEKAEAEALNEHIKQLVALYADQILQEFDQRLRDLEMLAAQPAGAVQFEVSARDVGSEAPDYTPTYTPEHQSDGSVPWYTG